MLPSRDIVSDNVLFLDPVIPFEMDRGLFKFGVLKAASKDEDLRLLLPDAWTKKNVLEFDHCKRPLYKEHLRGKYHCTFDLLFDWLELKCSLLHSASWRWILKHELRSFRSSILKYWTFRVHDSTLLTLKSERETRDVFKVHVVYFFQKICGPMTKGRIMHVKTQQSTSSNIKMNKFIDLQGVCSCP